MYKIKSASKEKSTISKVSNAKKTSERNGFAPFYTRISLQKITYIAKFRLNYE